MLIDGRFLSSVDARELIEGLDGKGVVDDDDDDAAAVAAVPDSEGARLIGCADVDMI